MFTGIIEAKGTIRALTPKGADVSLVVDSGSLDLSDVKLGDSIATNGVCLTVVELFSKGFSADVSVETMQRSGFCDAKVGSEVNLEKALMPTSRLGGHLVSGHVDGLGEIVSRDNLGRAIDFWVKAPDQLAKYITEKGSISIDGISLTVNEVDGARFRLTVIPHTAAETTILDFYPGRKVNIEVDQIARYLERLLLGEKAAEPAGGGLTMEALARAGFVK